MMIKLTDFIEIVDLHQHKTTIQVYAQKRYRVIITIIIKRNQKMGPFIKVLQYTIMLIHDWVMWKIKLG